MPQALADTTGSALTLLRTVMPLGAQEFSVCINGQPQTILVMTVDEWDQLPYPKPNVILSHTGEAVLTVIETPIPSPVPSQSLSLLCP